MKRYNSFTIWWYNLTHSKHQICKKCYHKEPEPIGYDWLQCSKCQYYIYDNRGLI